MPKIIDLLVILLGRRYCLNCCGRLDGTTAPSGTTVGSGDVVYICWRCHAAMLLMPATAEKIIASRPSVSAVSAPPRTGPDVNTGTGDLGGRSDT